MRIQPPCQIHPGYPNSHPELSPTAGRLSPASWGRVRWEHGGGDIPRSRLSSWSMKRFGRRGRVLRPLRPQPMEVVARVLTFENGFAVQHDAFSRYCPERFDNQRERRRPAQTATAPQPHALAILARDDAIAVVLDLVEPLRARGCDFGERRN